jgi:hypothetical protein
VGVRASIRGNECAPEEQGCARDTEGSASPTMTLLDARKCDAADARRVRSIEIALFVMVVLGAFGIWGFWNWPEEHRVNTFLATVESGDQAKAYGMWTQDPGWQQHPERFKAYGYDRFEKDWRSGSAFGQIRNYKFVLSRFWGNSVLMGVDINGGKKPIFLWVDRKTQNLDFSPAELYRPIWGSRSP